MERRYRVVVSAACGRDIQRARKRRPGVLEVLRETLHLLEHDPFNRAGRANIRKLAAVPPGEGQFRLRIGDYRLRYDVEGDEVILHSFRPRSISYR